MSMPSVNPVKNNKSSVEGILFDSRHNGELFDLSSITLSPKACVNIEFSSYVNLIMVVVGNIRVQVLQNYFNIEPGQVWLIDEYESCQIESLEQTEQVILLSVVIKPTMLTRFNERYLPSECKNKDISVRAVMHSERQKKANNSSNESRIMTQALDYKNIETLESKLDKLPLIFPSCELTRLSLESFRLFIEQTDEDLYTLKIEELLLLKLRSRHGEILRRQMRNKNNPVHERFRMFMKENVTQNWGVADYAENIGMSLTSFKSMFKEVYGGQSPKAWINGCRLRYADNQLRTTNKRMIDIAFESGFSSQSYFTQLFKAHYGISPSEARSSKT